MPSTDRNDGVTALDSHEHREYWERFYASPVRTAVPDDPSPFARWVAEKEQPGSLLEVGSGTGRDSVWFAQQGFHCLGLDYAESAVECAAHRASLIGADARYELVNLYHREASLDLAQKIADGDHPAVVYARFLVHAIEDDARQTLLLFARTALAGDGRLYLEYRTEQTQHEFGQHYRHFVPSDVVVAEADELGGTVTHREEGHGLAIYKAEDPRVCRLVISWGA